MSTPTTRQTQRDLERAIAAEAAIIAERSAEAAETERTENERTAAEEAARADAERQAREKRDILAEATAARKAAEARVLAENQSHAYKAIERQQRRLTESCATALADLQLAADLGPKPVVDLAVEACDRLFGVSVDPVLFQDEGHGMAVASLPLFAGLADFTIHARIDLANHERGDYALDALKVFAPAYNNGFPTGGVGGSVEVRKVADLARLLRDVGLTPGKKPVKPKPTPDPDPEIPDPAPAAAEIPEAPAVASTTGPPGPGQPSA